MAPGTQSIQVHDGTRLPYVEQGDPSGVPVLLLHGFTDSLRSYEPLLPHLPPRLHAFALTQRGHGDADRPASGYRPPELARDVADFVDALGLGPAVVVGHSMGSTVALRFAIDHPRRTRALVLEGAFAAYRRNPVVMAFWEQDVSQLTDPIDPGFVREFQQSTLARPVPPSFFETVVQESLKLPARVWRTTFGHLLDDDFADQLDRVAVPTLILWGGRDAFCSRSEQELLAGAIADARLVVYESAGHSPHWEEPARFAADLVAFIESLPGDASVE